MTLKQIGTTAIGLAILIGSGLFALPARAAFTMTLVQVGSSVLATGSGTIDVAGLTDFGITGVAAAINPSQAVVQAGLTTFVNSETYSGFLGSPNSFGIGQLTLADSGSGDTVGMGPGLLFVPQGYSGGLLSNSATFDNETLSGLGATPGVYQWFWPGDSFTLNIEAPTAAALPESSSALLLALPLGLVTLLAARRRSHPSDE